MCMVVIETIEQINIHTYADRVSIIKQVDHHVYINSNIRAK